MGLLKDTIRQQVNEKQIQQNYTGTTAVITNYNEVTNRASIKFTDPNSGAERTMNNVPVVMNMAGFRGAIEAGMKCNVSFSNGSVLSPTITGIISNVYRRMDISNNGGCIVNDSVLKATLPDDFVPMSKSWIDEDNTIDDKYYDPDTFVQMNTDCNTKSYEILRKISHMSGSDQGTTNLINGSTIRVKENGDIELFVNNNVGIRISNEDQKIYMYGLVVETNSQS